MADAFDPTNVNLTAADPMQVTCFLQLGENDYNGGIGLRVSAIFVILFVSSAGTFFPVLAKKSGLIKVSVYVYLFARYFGAGVIIATAFIHLMDPAYQEIGPQSCVGMTGNWASYSWPPAIILTVVMLMFLLDFTVERYVEMKYGVEHTHGGLEELITGVVEHPAHDSAAHGGDGADDITATGPPVRDAKDLEDLKKSEAEATAAAPAEEEEEVGEAVAYRSFRREIAAFLILEFGVIFHSVIIGLNLGTTGSEFNILYVIIVFHQSFEGLGIGARMSAIPFPRRWGWLQWALCGGYGVTTPIAIAIGLGLRTQYNPGSYTANVVSGLFDSMSAGVLIYTGLVELLARDFLFNPNRTMDNRRLAFMVVCTFLGAGIMALLGKWA